MLKALLLIAAFVPTTIGYADLLYCPVEKEYELAEEKCLATMIYGEARGENLQGQVAVAFTARNRAGKTQNKTVCNVVLAPKQYSIFNDNPALRAAALDPNIEPHQKNVIDKQSWKDAMKIAQDVMRDKLEDPTNGSTHYVAFNSLKRIPKWVHIFSKTISIGNHTFFKEPSG